MHTRNSGVLECVPLEPKANFEGFPACMARTDKSPRGSSQTQSSHSTQHQETVVQTYVMSCVYVCAYVCVNMSMRKRFYERKEGFLCCTHTLLFTVSYENVLLVHVSACGQVGWWLLMLASNTTEYTCTCHGVHCMCAERQHSLLDGMCV